MTIDGANADVGPFDIPGQLTRHDFLRAIVVEGIAIKVVHDPKGHTRVANGGGSDDAAVRNGLEPVYRAAGNVVVGVGLEHLCAQQRGEASGLNLYPFADGCKIAHPTGVDESGVFVATLLLSNLSVGVVEVEARAAVFRCCFINGQPRLIQGEGVGVGMGEVARAQICVAAFF